MCSKWNNLKPEEMPYEKCMTLGAESLTDAELLAILLRTGTKNHTVLEVAEKVLSMNPEFDGLVGMMHFTPEEYRQVEGIGYVKAVQLSVVGEIAHRIWQRAKRVKHTVFSRPELVAEYYMEDLRYLDHEVVRILYLDYQMQLLKDKLLSTGTCCRSAISSRRSSSKRSAFMPPASSWCTITRAEIRHRRRRISSSRVSWSRPHSSSGSASSIMSSSATIAISASENRN